MLYFYNDTAFDLMVLRAQGVSIKSGADSIGRFGTGMKYAIAGVIRLGGTITLLRDGRSVRFTARPVQIRNTEVQMIFMDEEMLGFGLDLGKHWKPWMLYRELVSNAWDEGGDVSVFPRDAQTVIAVSCDVLDSVHSEQSSYFTRGLRPIFTSDELEVFTENPGIIYNQGIRVGEESSMKFSYNIRARLELNEDRSLSFRGQVWAKISNDTIEQGSTPAGLQIFLQEDTEMQQRIVSYTNNLSEAALAAAESPSAPLALKQKAMSLLHARGLFTPCPLTTQEQKMFDRALHLAQTLENCTADEFQFTEAIAGSYGLYHSSTESIWISRRAFRGVADLAATLLEEIFHKRHGFSDETRAFQDYLLKRLVAIAELEA